MTLFSLTIVLLFIMDPLGNIKNFAKYLDGLPSKRQKVIIAREMLIALGFILLFNFIGEYLYSLLSISNVTAYLASALILFLVAIKILFPQFEGSQPKKEGEPLLFPLAVPMIAGPALLATVMLYADTEPSPWVMLGAIFISWVIASIILLSSKTLIRVLGTPGLTACEKLLGMILVLLSIQRFLQGILLLRSQV